MSDIGTTIRKAIEEFEDRFIYVDPYLNPDDIKEFVRKEIVAFMKILARFLDE